MSAIVEGFPIEAFVMTACSDCALTSACECGVASPADDVVGVFYFFVFFYDLLKYQSVCDLKLFFFNSLDQC